MNKLENRRFMKLRYAWIGICILTMTERVAAAMDSQQVGGGWNSEILHQLVMERERQIGSGVATEVAEREAVERYVIALTAEHTRRINRLNTRQVVGLRVLADRILASTETEKSRKFGMTRDLLGQFIATELGLPGGYSFLQRKALEELMVCVNLFNYGHREAGLMRELLELWREMDTNGVQIKGEMEADLVTKWKSLTGATMYADYAYSNRGVTVETIGSIAEWKKAHQREKDLVLGKMVAETQIPQPSLATDMSKPVTWIYVPGSPPTGTYTTPTGTYERMTVKWDGQNPTIEQDHTFNLKADGGIARASLECFMITTLQMVYHMEPYLRYRIMEYPLSEIRRVGGPEVERMVMQIRNIFTGMESGEAARDYGYIARFRDALVGVAGAEQFARGEHDMQEFHTVLVDKLTSIFSEIDNIRYTKMSPRYLMGMIKTEYPEAEILEATLAPSRVVNRMLAIGPVCTILNSRIIKARANDGSDYFRKLRCVCEERRNGRTNGQWEDKERFIVDDQVGPTRDVTVMRRRAQTELIRELEQLYADVQSKKGQYSMKEVEEIKRTSELISGSMRDEDNRVGTQRLEIAEIHEMGVSVETDVGEQILHPLDGGSNYEIEYHIVQTAETYIHPEVLHVSMWRFAFDPTNGTTIKKCNKRPLPKVVHLTLKNGAVIKYALKSVVVHRGTTRGGHYWYLSKDGDRWNKADDGSVTPISDIDAEKEISGTGRSYDPTGAYAVYVSVQ
jgi:hypothetical protein